MVRITSLSLGFTVAALLLGGSILFAETQNNNSGEGSQMTATTEVIKPNVALVNGKPISRKILEREILHARQKAANRGKELSEEQLAQIKAEKLDYLINSELFYQACLDKGMKAAPEEVQSELDRLKQKFPDNAKWQEVLNRMQMSETDLRRMIEKDLGIQNLIQHEITAKIKITSEESRTFYDTHPEYFEQPEQVRARHILIKVDKDADETTKANARQRIGKILDQLKAGGDFGKLAKEYSEGPSKDFFGDLGFFKRGQMVKPFEDAAFALKVNELSDVVETSFGFHLIQVMERKEASNTSYEEAQADIEKYLIRERKKVEVNAYLDKLKAKAEIKRLM